MLNVVNIISDSIEGIKAKTGQEDLEDAFVVAIGESLGAAI